MMLRCDRNVVYFYFCFFFLIKCMENNIFMYITLTNSRHSPNSLLRRRGGVVHARISTLGLWVRVLLLPSSFPCVLFFFLFLTRQASKRNFEVNKPSDNIICKIETQWYQNMTFYFRLFETHLAYLLQGHGAFNFNFKTNNL